MTGWDLLQTVQQTIGYFWNVTSSHVYRELNALHAAGLIKAGKRGARSKRPFSPTAKGRRAFAAWIAQQPAQELIRFPLFVTVFFGHHLDPASLTEFLEMHRGHHQERLEQYRQIEVVAAHADAFMNATLRFGMAYEEAALAWFDAQLSASPLDPEDPAIAHRLEVFDVLRSLPSRPPDDMV